MGLGHAAGIGVPLVAMICHSADPLLLLSGERLQLLVEATGAIND
jgi:hypothetical protein